MHTYNIILALFAAAQLLHAKTLEEKTEKLTKMWQDLKAYPTLCTKTGKITAEDTIDMVDGTELWKSMQKVGEAFYIHYRDLLSAFPPPVYRERPMKNEDFSVHNEWTFKAMRRDLTDILHSICDGWKTTSIYEDLTSRWIKAHDLIVQNP